MTTTNVRETSRLVAIVDTLVAAYERREDRMHMQIDRLRQMRERLANQILPLGTAVLKALGIYKETNSSAIARMACLLSSIKGHQISELQQILTPEQMIHLAELHQELVPPEPHVEPSPSPPTPPSAAH